MAGAEKKDNSAIADFTSEKHDFRLVRIHSGLSHPWAVAFLPDGGFLLTERGGRLLFLENGTAREVTGLPKIATGGQGGLLDLALDPDFAVNRLVYFSYSSAGSGGSGTAVARARLEGTTLTGLQVIWEMNIRTSTGHHYGSRLRFLPDKTLLITTGERGDMDRAQNLADAAGKIHRINRDGSIPADNPFIGISGALPSVYSYGHRNPQGLAVHPETGQIWATEHGPKGGDELNLIKGGGNYGWPVVTHGRQYGTGAPIGEGTSKPGMVDPVTFWTPSPAPSGLDFYQGDKFPAWQGDLFSGNLAGTRLIRIRLTGGQVIEQEDLLPGTIGRIRDVRTGPNGYIYLLTDEEKGGLYRLEPKE
jgi:glucose/arabinose dehydrogenase